MDKQAQNNFVLGRRLGYYQRLSDMDTSMNRDFVDKKLATVKGQDLEAIFHDLRRQVI
ncbi:hypothetical protein [Desulfobacula sp.]|uniref:hypothetical protein n=1 Tax=Desulfobacula sp. TaxID=2593537 RepID=UPI00260BDE68|nr:hypothetical protein [Desulfobacula sp.]